MLPTVVLAESVPPEFIYKSKTGQKLNGKVTSSEMLARCFWKVACSDLVLRDKLPLFWEGNRANLPNVAVGMIFLSI